MKVQVSTLRRSPNRLRRIRDLPRNFAAIDFETADRFADSAISVGISRVIAGKLESTTVKLIRPPRRRVYLSHIHGIEWHQVENEPPFRDLWPELAALFAGCEFLVAHNSGFDKGVLHACCKSANVPAPPLGFECTVRLARTVWKLFPTKLPDVCRFLGIPLKHHDAGSDAEACARITIEAIAAAEKAAPPPAPAGPSLFDGF